MDVHWIWAVTRLIILIYVAITGLEDVRGPYVIGPSRPRSELLFNESEAVRFLKVGLLCVEEISGARPRMSTAVKMMCGNTEVDGVEISPPSIINDITDAKIGRRRSPPRASAGGRSPLLIFDFLIL